jgi:hypothetical protein
MISPVLDIYHVVRAVFYMYLVVQAYKKGYANANFAHNHAPDNTHEGHEDYKILASGNTSTTKTDTISSSCGRIRIPWRS